MSSDWNGVRDGRCHAAGRWRGRLAGVAALAFLLLAIQGCGQAPVRLNGRPTAGSGLPLSGVYEAKVSAPFAGTFTGRLTAEPTKEGFRANTRPGAAWPLIGGLERYLGPIFMPYLFPSGVILSWNSGLPADGKPGEGWLGPGGMHRYGVRTLMDTPDGPVRLVLPDGRAIAIMTLRPAPEHAAYADYPLVAERIEDTVRTRLFVQAVDGKTVPPPGLEAFLSQVRSSAQNSQDDIEFAFGTAMAARSNLKFFPVAIRVMDEEAERALSEWPEKDRTTVQWSYDDATGIGTLNPDVFLGTEDVDRAMEEVLAKSPRALVIDLRGCPGVEFSALRVASWLSDSSLDGGTFYGPGGPQEPTELQLKESADFDLAGTTLDSAGAIKVEIEPAAHPFAGPVAVLTSKRTAGSAEALVAILKGAGRVKLVGEQTAGRVVLSRPFDVGQGWIFRMPGAGWIAPDGNPIGPKGVEPDVRASPSAAPTRAAEALKQ